MKIKNITIAIIVLILSLILGNSENIQNKTKINGKIMKVPENIEVIKHEIDSLGTLEVIVKNNTRKEIDCIKITAECYDKENNNLGKKSSGKYNVNTTDNHVITIYCGSKTEKYNLYIEYE